VSRFGGASSAEIAAPVAACFELVCDTLRTPEWHRAVMATVILERDGERRTSLVRTSIDAIVTQVAVDLRLSYDGQRALHMERESGDLRDLTVTWTFEDLGGGRTQANFQTEFDPGRVLSILATGPVVRRLEAHLAEQPPDGLRQAVEARR
jgi:ribosome-associated toxin RatA of RatAB toxin-antitoxin module